MHLLLLLECMTIVFTGVAAYPEAIVVNPSKNERVQVDTPSVPFHRFPPNGPPPPFRPNFPPDSQFEKQYPSITVELSEDSGRGLSVLPGSASWIYFEVTNRKDYPVNLRFLAEDEKGFVANVKPEFFLLQPGRSVRVGVFLEVINSVPLGTTSNVRMWVDGSPDSRPIRRALVKVGSQESDSWGPSCSSKITKDCGESLDTWKCQSAFWIAEATLKDDQSGLLKVSSQPPIGFEYNSNFYAGTREEVKLYFQASCCEKEIEIIGVDLQGNYGRCKINVAGLLNAGEIAAIVLGVLLLIAIIIVIIVVIVLCRRRRTQTLKL